MVAERVRPIALGIPWRDGEVLVAQLDDSVKAERFYRPVGGEIEFGESSRAALVREFKEELGADIEVNRYLGTIENRFTFEGLHGHEIGIVYEVSFLDDIPGSRPLTGHDDGDRTFQAAWESIATLREAEVTVYPEGVLDLLNEDVDHVPPSRD